MAPLSLLNFTDVDSIALFFDLDEFLDRSFVQILTYLKTLNEVDSIVVEECYIDQDFTSEFSNLYSKTFRARDGYCKRLHFFKEKFVDIDDFISKFNSETLTYFGFIVKRPLNVGKVGRSLIFPYNFTDKQLYYLCLISREVHLLGKTITVTGVPFIEQDSMVITCAQAGIWIVSKYMHYLHSHTRHLPYDITEKAYNALSNSDRALPSSGLTIEQMMAALNKMGYSPILYHKPFKNDFDHDEAYKVEYNSWRPIENIYYYIESQIPVLISFRNHVCTIIGHKLKPVLDAEDIEFSLRYNTDEADNNVITSSAFVDAFVVHDDREGIYKLLPVKPKDRTAISQDPQLSKILHEDYNNILDDIDGVIIPLPDKIYLLGEDVFGHSVELLNIDKGTKNGLVDYINKGLKAGNKYARELAMALSPKAKDNPVVFRIYFIKSVQFKQNIQLNENIDPELKKLYMQMELPKFIWVNEISTNDLYSQGNKIIGEIIFDSTANRYDSKSSYLTAHLPGSFILNKRIYKNTASTVYDLKVEEPYALSDRSKYNECSIK